MPRPIGQGRLDATPLSFTKVNVYKMFRFRPEEIQDNEEEKDTVKAIPMKPGLPHRWFDTVVVVVKDDAESTGLQGKL